MSKSTKPIQKMFNRQLKSNQKTISSQYKEKLPYQAAFDYPLINIVKRLNGIKKNFKRIAFVGPNPYLFLQHLNNKDYDIDKFYFCEPSKESVEKSYEIINKKVSNGFYEKLNVNLPNEIIPQVIDEETDWSKVFKADEFDLIVNNMTLHWLNDAEGTLRAFQDTLEPDGVFIASLFGQDTLQELRICLSLAESERDGGVSPNISPMVSITDMGNIFSRCKYNLPTIDIQHLQYEFTSTFQLLEFLRDIGEQNALYERRGQISADTFIAAAALYETLFSKRIIGHRDENSNAILVDSYSKKPMHDDIKDVVPANNIISTFDILFLIGWKYHESQQQAKQKGTAKFSLKDVVKEMNEQDDEEGGEGQKKQIKYGMLIDDGDEVKEIIK